MGDTKLRLKKYPSEFHCVANSCSKELFVRDCTDVVARLGGALPLLRDLSLYGSNKLQAVTTLY
jgi:hypothetical protein